MATPEDVIDEFVSRFEAAWETAKNGTGQPPQAEDTLAEIVRRLGEVHRGAALRAIIDAEVGLRREAAKLDKALPSPTPEDYYDRFDNVSKYRQIIDDVFLPPTVERDSDGNAKASENSAHDSGLAELRAELPDSKNMIGPYQKIGDEPLGRGGMGEVWLAKDPKTGRQVAIKTALSKIMNPQELLCIWRELRTLANLRHPHIVQLFGDECRLPALCQSMTDDEIRAAIQAEPPYLVMEYIPGSQTIANVIAGVRPPFRRLAEIMHGIAQGVAFAHEQNPAIYHRDLKPGNILLDGDVPKIADFGLAVSEDRQDLYGVAGTQFYMSPEQWRGENDAFGAADVWSLGIILYQFLTRKFPFRDREQILDQQFRPKPLHEHDPEIPNELVQLCDGCLNKDARKRFTAKHVVKQLAEWLAAATLAAPSVPTSRTGRRDGQPTTNLSSPSTSFVGREREVQELTGLFNELNGTTALITLCGPPGSGKTRLASELGQLLLAHFPGGCWFADLSDARTVDEVAYAVAKSFDVSLPGKAIPLEEVSNFLEYRKPLLLILDNFEQVVDCGSATIGYWRERTPHASCLVTSRCLLNLMGEIEYHVGPLEIPDSDGLSELSVEEITATASVKLFIDRASQANLNLMPDGASAAVIAEICARLDGIPLAIELAAARTRVLSLPQLLNRLSSRFQLLKSGRRDVAQRHATLSAAIDWSVQLLQPWEHIAFLQLSQFRSGFLLESAEQVLNLSDFSDAPLVVDVLQALCEKSLVETKETSSGPRFRMLASIQEYADNHWQATTGEPSRQALHRRLAMHFLEYAETWHARILGSTVVEALNRLSDEMSNLLSVHSWAVAEHDWQTAARLLLAIDESLGLRGPRSERVPRIEATLSIRPVELDGLSHKVMLSKAVALFYASEWTHASDIACQLATNDPPLDCLWVPLAATAVHAKVLSQRGQLREAFNLLTVAAESLDEMGERRWFAHCLDWAAFVCYQLGEARTGLELSKKALMAAQSMENSICESGVYNTIGLLHKDLNELPQSLDFSQSSLRIDQRLGNRSGYAAVLSNIGDVYRMQGKYTDAIACFEEAERINREYGNTHWLAANLHNRGMCKASEGHLHGAIRDFTDAEMLNRKTGNRMWISLNLTAHGCSLMDMECYDAALVAVNNALAINIEIQWDRANSFSIGHKGRILARLGQSEEAISLLRKAEELNRQYKDQENLAENMGSRGRLHFELGSLLEAHAALKQSLALYGILNLCTLDCFEISAILADVETGLGNLTAAHEAAQQALELAKHFNLTDDHEAKRFARLLPRVRAILAPIKM